jgi:hypothetical protein
MGTLRLLSLAECAPECWMECSASAGGVRNVSLFAIVDRDEIQDE